MFSSMNKGLFRAFGKPVVNIFIDGKKAIDWISFQVHMDGQGGIDSFMAEYSWDVSDSPKNALFYSGSQAVSGLAKNSAVLKIECGFENEEMTPLIEGDIDSIAWDFSSGERVRLYGRSYASRPYDFVETVKYQNFTATEAHKKICEIHGFTPVSPVATGDFIGQYQNEDHATIPEEMNHWDYILYLAEQEGFISRIRGTTWYFGPLEQFGEYLKEPLAFSYGHNVRNLKMKRAPNAARNFRIEVMSWLSGDRKSRGTRILEMAQVGDPEGKNQYVLRRFVPNITTMQAQKMAQNIADALSRQQFSGSFETEYFSDIMCDRKIALYGVGLGLSEIYHLTQISITGSKEHGIQCSLNFTSLPKMA